MVNCEWKKARLKDAADFLDHLRKPVSSSDRAKMKGVYPYYGASGIVDYVNDYIYDEPLILLGEDGENILSRNLPLAFLVDGKIWVNNHAHVLRAKEGVNREYLCAFLESLDYTDLNSGTAQPKLNQEKCKNIQIYLPEFKEQTAIARALSDVDSLISSLQKLIEKKKAIKQGAMQELLTGKKRLPGFSGEWSKQQLGDICNIINGGTPSTSVAEFWNGKILWCTPTDITSCSTKYIYTTESKITESGLKASSATLLPKGALLLCSRATIGEVRIAGNAICTNQGFKSLVVHQNISNEWLYYMMHVLKSQMLEKAIGSTFLEISKKDLAELDIIVPEFTEQKAIAQVLSDMDSEIEQLEKKLAKYQQIKQGMMQELLTGRIRLVDADGKEQPKPQAVQEKQLQTSHNQYFDDAVMIAGIVNAFYSEKYPLGRKKVQKLLTDRQTDR